MEFILIGLIVVLLSLVIWLLFFLKKKHKDFDRLIEEYQQETAISLAKVENNFKMQNEETIQNVKEEYENKITEYETYVDSVKKFTRNETEINTHKTLLEVKNELIRQEAIKPLQMMILPNIYLPQKKVDDEIQSIKISHIVLLSTGLYMIDTKDWEGNILYGITKEKSKEFSFILDEFFPALESHTEKTIVSVNRYDDGKELNVKAYEAPHQQVVAASASLEEILQGSLEEISITPILYFGHWNKRVQNLSQASLPKVIDEESSLYDFFEQELKNRAPLYSVAELERTKELIERVDHNP